jgi:hypothetical protein
VLLNRGANAVNVTVQWADFDNTTAADCGGGSGTGGEIGGRIQTPIQRFTVRDLWTHADVGTFSTYTVEVAPESAVTVLLKPQ